MVTKWTLPPDVEADGLEYSFVFVAHGQIRMKVTGNGMIPGKGERQPWLRYRNRISELWIGEGVTEIGDRAFAGYGWLERIWLPESVQEIGHMAFSCCPRLQEITYAGNTGQLKQVIMTNSLPEHFYRKER